MWDQLNPKHAKCHRSRLTHTPKHSPPLLLGRRAAAPAPPSAHAPVFVVYVMMSENDRRRWKKKPIDEKNPMLPVCCLYRDEIDLLDAKKKRPTHSAQNPILPSLSSI